MAFVKHYIMIANTGSETALGEALRALRDKVTPMEGCKGVQLLRDAKEAAKFVFIETWVSAEAYKAAGAVLGKEALVPVMAVLATPPQSMSLTPEP